MAVAVLIVWQPGDPDREHAFEWVQAKYAERHPDWEVVVGTCAGPWVKAHAYTHALEQTDAGTLVLVDADVWCDETAQAVMQVEFGMPWAIPHRRVHRLTKQATLSYMDGMDPEHLPLAERAYAGCPSGGIVALSRRVAKKVPMDPRFVGWGGEDRAWGYALECFYGGPWLGGAPLWHLWHQPQPRETRNRGNAANEALKLRYDAARCDPVAMRELIEEVRRVCA